MNYNLFHYHFMIIFIWKERKQIFDPDSKNHYYII